MMTNPWRAQRRHPKCPGRDVDETPCTGAGWSTNGPCVTGWRGRSPPLLLHLHPRKVADQRSTQTGSWVATHRTSQILQPGKVDRHRSPDRKMRATQQTSIACHQSRGHVLSGSHACASAFRAACSTHPVGLGGRKENLEEELPRLTEEAGGCRRLQQLQASHGHQELHKVRELSLVKDCVRGCVNA